MDELKAKYRVTAIVAGVQIAVIVFLAALGWFNVFKFEPTFSSSTGSIVTALWVGIIFLAVGSFLLRRTQFSWEKLTDTMLLKGRTGLINTLRNNAILLSSLAVVIAVLGIIVTALTADESQILRASTVALIVALMNFPRQGVWKKIVANLEKLDEQR
jgi:hypothetical protein